MSNEKTEICLHGNRRLINACRKEGLELYNPLGKFNGYGYPRLPLTVVLNNEKERQTYDRLKAEVDEAPVKEPKTEEEKIAAWSRRLSRLLNNQLTLEQCIDIANEKLYAKELSLAKLEEKQDERFSVRRQKVINKVARKNPLRYIRDEAHARNIIEAHERHTGTNYDTLLEKYRSDEQWGIIPPGSAREYARRDMTPLLQNPGESTDANGSTHK